MNFPRILAVATTLVSIPAMAPADVQRGGTAPGFADELAASFPPSIAMPKELRAALDWLESQGAVQHYRNPSEDGPLRFATLYPADSGVPEFRQSLAVFQVFPDFHYEGASYPADIRDRLVWFARTGGDGSMAGLWIDDAGKTQIVHFGSGSGSIWWGVATDSMLDFLRFLAIGYTEPAFDEHHDSTPMEAFLFNYGLDGIDPADLDPQILDEAPAPPRAFQAFLTERFGTTIPERGSQVITSPRGDRNPPVTPFESWLFGR